MKYWVYIVRCGDGSYYTGSHRGTHIENRVGEHNSAKYRGYTFTRRPVVLVWCEEFQRVTDAIIIERRIKGWSRKKKEALIEGRLEDLSDLAAAKWSTKPCSS